MIIEPSWRTTIRAALGQMHANRRTGKPPRGFMERDLEAWLEAFLKLKS